MATEEISDEAQLKIMAHMSAVKQMFVDANITLIIRFPTEEDCILLSDEGTPDEVERMIQMIRSIQSASH